MQLISRLYGTRLTPRESEIRELVFNGYSSKQIAQRLAISEYTVANHRKNILKKKGVKKIKDLLCPNETVVE